MFVNLNAVLALVLVFTFGCGVYYGIMGFLGVTRRNVTYWTLVQGPFPSRLIHAEGDGALFHGIILLVVAIPCLLLPLGVAVNLILHWH